MIHHDSILWVSFISSRRRPCKSAASAAHQSRDCLPVFRRFSELFAAGTHRAMLPTSNSYFPFTFHIRHCITSKCIMLLTMVGGGGCRTSNYFGILAHSLCIINNKSFITISCGHTAKHSCLRKHIKHLASTATACARLWVLWMLSTQNYTIFIHKYGNMRMRIPTQYVAVAITVPCTQIRV